MHPEAHLDVAAQRSAVHAEVRQQSPEALCKSDADPSAASPHAEPAPPEPQVLAASQVPAQPLLLQSPQPQALVQLLEPRPQAA